MIARLGGLRGTRIRFTTVACRIMINSSSEGKSTYMRGRDMQMVVHKREVELGTFRENWVVVCNRNPLPVYDVQRTRDVYPL